MYRARLGDDGALAIYRGAHRPRVRERRGEDAAEEAAGGEDAAEEAAEQEEGEEGGGEAMVPAEEGDTEPEGDAVFEGPAYPPWQGIEAIFDQPQPEDEEDKEEEDSQAAFGSDLLSAPSVRSLETDSQPSSEHIIEVTNSPGECINMLDIEIAFACCEL